MSSNKPVTWNGLLKDKADLEQASLLVFGNIDRWGIGFGPTIQTLRRFSETLPTSYPPYNINKKSDTDYQIVVALAGFQKENLSVIREADTLHIRSVDSKDSESDKPKPEIVHRGIAMRHFDLSFAIAENIEITEAELSNGLLVIDLHLEIPEEKKPKAIPIK